MKRLFAIIAFLATCAFQMSAQQDSFDKMLSALSAQSASFEYSFSTNASIKMTGSGKVLVQDTCFKVEGNGLEIWSDGESIWTIDRAGKEGIIEDVSDSSMDMANPAQFLASAKTAFTRQLTTSSMVVLVPKAKSEIKQIKLYIKDGENPVLTKVVATTSDGTDTEFTIKNMKYSKKQSVESFVFDTKTLSSDFIITDLR